MHKILTATTDQQKIRSDVDVFYETICSYGKLFIGFYFSK